MERLGRKLRRVKDAESAVALAGEIESVVEQARGSRQLFAHLLDPDDFERQRPRAQALIRATVQQLQQFLRGVSVDSTGVPDDLRLPAGSTAEWTSLFQNVLVNAANAMLDSDERRVDIGAGRARSRRWILVQDTGAGIELQVADRLFEPFARQQRISSDRRELGFGGTGLGLTIVRMLAARAGCAVAFVEPDRFHSTAFQLSWSET
jgi:signal transduction histidine kinase